MWHVQFYDNFYNINSTLAWAAMPAHLVGRASVYNISSLISNKMSFMEYSIKKLELLEKQPFPELEYHFLIMISEKPKKNN